MPLVMLSSTVDPGTEEVPCHEADMNLDDTPVPPLTDALSDEEFHSEHESVLEIDSDDNSFGDDDEEADPEDLAEVKVYDLLTSFFRINPEPTDEEVHALASALRMTHEKLESIIFSVMSLMMEDPELVDDTRDLIS